MYNCFKASCQLTGTKKVGLTVDDIRLLSRSDPTIFSPPAWVTSINGNRLVVEYLERWGISECAVSNPQLFWYDPDNVRVVFAIIDKGRIVDMSGRALNKFTKPKWKRYGLSRHPFIIGTNSCAVVVEDCVSACKVSLAGYTGVALLGTKLLHEHVQCLSKYDSVVFALDPDAFGIAYDMARKLRLTSNNVRVVNLSADPKYFTPEQLQTLIGK